jgi:hypothetical protein
MFLKITIIALVLIFFKKAPHWAQTPGPPKIKSQKAPG